MATIELKGDDVLVIDVPGLTAVRIDPRARVIAIDGISGTPGAYGSSDALTPAWQVLDLRGGTYGGFHRLIPADICFDVDCAGAGQHVGPAADNSGCTTEAVFGPDDRWPLPKGHADGHKYTHDAQD
jgi:hypothetical protein